MVDENGLSPLHRLLLSDKSEYNTGLVKLFLARGADPDLKDRNGYTILLRIAENSSGKNGPKSTDLEMMKLLIEEGADIDAITTHRGYTALMLRAMDGWGCLPSRDGRRCQNDWQRDGIDCIVQTLLERGANMEARDDRGRTALRWAVVDGITTQECCRRRRLATAKFLLDWGADVDARDNDGRTVLFRVIVGLLDTDWVPRGMDTPNIELLLDRGTDINVKDNQAKTALDWARERRSLPYAKVLGFYCTRTRMLLGKIQALSLGVDE